MYGYFVLSIKNILNRTCQIFDGIVASATSEKNSHLVSNERKLIHLDIYLFNVPLELAIPREFSDS